MPRKQKYGGQVDTNAQREKKENVATRKAKYRLGKGKTRKTLKKTKMANPEQKTRNWNGHARILENGRELQTAKTGGKISNEVPGKRFNSNSSNRKKKQETRPLERPSPS